MAKNVTFRSMYGYDTNAVSREGWTDDFGPSLTVQSDSVDADINVIVKRFGLTGVMPANLRLPEYGDYEGISDFRSALDAISAASDSFMEMPAHVRAQFQNDPQEFLEFCANRENLPKLRELGLAIPEVKVDNAPSAPVAPVEEKT